MNVSNSIKYIGVNDHLTDLFEGQYSVPNGIAYNSYVILDDKIAVMDSVDARFAGEWLNNLSRTLGERTPDYLVIQHMEPDHSSSILDFAKAYPNVVIVSSQKAFNMMKNFFDTEFSDKRLVVGEGDSLNLGKHTLSFVTAPMVHWPEVIMTYDSYDKVLFSADAFGKFGALDVSEDWLDEARRYYIGIVGKYGVQVQNVLKKASGFDIQTICPLHGPVLCDNLEYYLSKYDTWSKYLNEESGIVVAYTSIYGNTRKVAEKLYNMLRERGANTVIYDLARCDISSAVADAFKYSTTVFATPTYNGDVFPFMRFFIEHLTERNYQGKKVAFIENGSWAPMATKVMKSMLENSKNLSYAENNITINSACNNSIEEKLVQLADELV